MTEQEHADVQITLTIATDDVAAALRLAEHLARTAMGYALDGHDTAIEINRLDHTQLDDTNPDD